jgi:hypothetical protein
MWLRCALAATLAIGLATPAVGDSFDRADADGDGKISKAEFQHVGEKATAALRTVLDQPPPLTTQEIASKKLAASGIDLLPELHAFWVGIFYHYGIRLIFCLCPAACIH